jgi:3-hydroxyacyl-[acyl-carrier-protein] dehydratase
MSILDELGKTERTSCIIDFAGITKLLPHRYPFLLVDKILEYDQEAQTMVGQKNVTFNEPFFQGHFPEEPVMPGVLQIEAMAQTGCILMYLLHESETLGKRPAFMGVDACRFRKPVRPGDVLRIQVKEVKWRRNIGTIECKILCEDDVVSDATLMATMV